MNLTRDGAGGANPLNEAGSYLPCKNSGRCYMLCLTSGTAHMDLLINTFGTRIRSSGERIVLALPVTAKYKMKKEYPIRALEEIIILRPSSISTGAVQLALEAGVDIVYLNSFGTPVGRIFSSGPKGMAELRKAQVVFSSSPKTPGAFQDTRGRQGSLSVIE